MPLNWIYNFNMSFKNIKRNIETCKPNWVNSILIISGVNLLMLGGLHIQYVCSEFMLVENDESEASEPKWVKPYDI